MSDIQVVSAASDLLHAFKSALQDELSNAGVSLTPTEVKVLRVIERQDSCTPLRLTRVLNRDKAQITRMLATLEKKQLIARKQNPEDKRSQLIEVTDYGSQLIKESKRPEAHITERMATGVSAADLTKCLNILNKLSRNLSQ